MYNVDEEKKSPVVEPTDQEQQVVKKEPQQAGVREDEGTVVDGVFTVAPQFSGSQVRDIATRYRAANPNSGDYYMHDGVKYSYADLNQQAPKPVQDAPMREPKGYYQKVNGGVVSGGVFIADDNLTKEEAEQAAIAYGDSVGNDDAYYYQYGGKIRKAKKSLFGRPDSEKPKTIDTTGYAEQHRVNNGTVVDGLFVADDNLLADAARNVAMRYYLNEGAKGNAFYYQHNGKIYVADRTQRADTKNVPEGERPAPVKVFVETPAPQPVQTKPTQQVQPVQQVKQEAKPVATTETKPAQQTVATEAKPATQQVQNQEAKPAPAPQVNTQQAQEKGKEKGGFFNAVGGFLGDVKDNVSEFAEGVRDNMQARKVQRELEGREIPENQRPALGTPAKGRIEAQEAARFKEASKKLKPLENEKMESLNRQLDEDNREFVDGGYAVNGYFVADDSLDFKAATTAAKKYYAGKHGDYKGTSPTSKHDMYQWRGIQYPTKEKEGSTLRNGDNPPKIVKTSDYAKYDELKAEKARLEAELPEKPAMAAAQGQATKEQAAKDASLENVVTLVGTGGQRGTVAQGGATEEKTEEKADANAKTEVKTGGQAQEVVKAAETPEGSQTKPAANTPVAAAPATATPATTSPAASTARPAQTAPAGATPAANSAAPAATSAPASSTPATTQTASTGTEEPEDTYTKNEKFLKEQAEKQKEEVRKIYDNEIGGYDKLYEEAMKRKEALADLDKKRSKKESAYRYITGVGDLVSGFANLVGTAHNASNQDQTYVAPELVKKAEAARKERKLEMDALNKRLDEMRARKDALTTQRDTKLSEIDAKMVSDISKANLQKASDERALNIQGMKDQIEKEKIAGRIAVAETKAANSLNNTKLRITTSQGGRVKNATFYDANGKPQVLNVYAIDDVGEEVIKAVNANKTNWSAAEQAEYDKALKSLAGSVTTPSDNGKALELFYEKMAQKPYVYQHFKRLVGGTTSTTTTTSTTRTSGGSSVDSALEGL